MHWLDFVEFLARLILVLLLILSIWSVRIIIDRYRFFKSISLPSLKIKESLRSKKNEFYGNHFYDELLSEISRLKTTEQIDKAFDAYVVDKKKELEKGLAVLGTLGSTTPFIGLLGTILGIIVSFGELSNGSGDTNSVMFSLAEALVLTAAGLMVAIPAVIAFNYFNKKVKSLLSEGESLKDLYIAYRE